MVVRAHSTTNQFAGEEVWSNDAYPGEYTGAKLIGVQASILRQEFPSLGSMNEELASSPLVALAEGRFVIPDWRKVAPTYGEAVAIVIAKLATKRLVYNYREGQLGPACLREHPRTIEMWNKVRAQQKGNDLLVIDAQFGLRHRGRSIRRAREMFASNEFGFGAFAFGCMVLAHPERFVRWHQLQAHCAGDEYDFVAAGLWGCAPVWCMGSGELDGRLCFNALGVGLPSDGFGSVSGFLPK